MSSGSSSFKLGSFRAFNDPSSSSSLVARLIYISTFKDSLFKLMTSKHYQNKERSKKENSQVQSKYAIWSSKVHLKRVKLRGISRDGERRLDSLMLNIVFTSKITKNTPIIIKLQKNPMDFLIFSNQVTGQSFETNKSLDFVKPIK